MGIVDALNTITGPGRVSTSDAVCLSYQYNCFFGKERVMKPDIVVLAETTEQVSEILKAANRYNVPVTPKGAVGGSGLGGPLHGGILLDLSLMDGIITIDADNLKAIAEAGCSFYRLSQELFRRRLMLPTPSYGSGPNVAASAVAPANGYGETRYGPNIDLVEGLEVVLPSGEVARVGAMAYADSDFGPYYRYITGPDLVGLFTRSNGALGVITKVAYQCLHRPKHWAFHAYYWPSGQLEEATRVLMEAAAIEIFDTHINDRWRYVGPGEPPLPDDCYFVLLFIVNAENELELKGKEQAVADICNARGGTCLPGFARNFHTQWPTPFPAGQGRAPRQPAALAKGSGRACVYILDEFIYPTSRLPEVYVKLLELCRKYGLWDVPHKPILLDGYPMKRLVMSAQALFFIDDRDRHLVERYYDLQGEFREWYGEKGGTFQLKLPPLVPDYCWTNQPGAYNLFKSIKGLLDPNNILSPGTI